MNFKGLTTCTKQTMLSYKSYKSYIHRVLRQVHPDKHITKKAMECVDGIIRTVGTRLSSDAHTFTHGTEKKTLATNEVQSAVRVLFSGELCKYALTEGTNAVCKYTESLATAEKNTDTPAKPVMRETRAGLIFSVSLAEKYLRGFGQVKYNIAGSAPVYLAAVLEYFTAEILELAGNVCGDLKRMNVTVRHIYLAVKDSDINNTLRKMNVVVLGGGVVPNINTRLLVQKPKKALRRKKTDKKTDKETKRPHRWRPGTVALREIKNFQKTCDLLVQHAPFERVVREVAKQYANDLRFTREFMTAFQNLVEYDMIDMLMLSNDLCCHANRETVQVSDIDLAIRIQELPSVAVETKNDIPLAAMSKLALRAGIKRIGHDAKERVKSHFITVANHYLKYVLLVAQHNRRQTVNTRFLVEGLSLIGVCLATVPERRRAARTGNLSRTNSQSSDTESVYNPDTETRDEDTDTKRGGRGNVAVATTAGGSEPAEEDILDDLDEEDEEDLVSE